ncbi:polysaccharide pyruvyl transferase [Isoptericola sp. CG 20/1183]|uniref:Polysaccharide pyruvyl transferase n=1 Tax=Isoptericola halotolerans TaxID=300560 RepID=A0ABX5EEW0_9MICO|nr:MULTISPECIES: polysaccharide pyruvyl transferase family protein [Isoptericola]PRZ06538.1 polysaccharide pyruvyl transferase [Isoptericola halotolerans]PRZ06656.1 polysaccharide pyruvyl transferase [Isoptericola sp. CG 20/1183]
MTRRRACVLRMHEAQTRVNWGGRSTSLALAEILERHAGRTVVSTIGAPHILGQLGDTDVRTDGHSVFEVVEELAVEIAAPRPATTKLAEVQAAISAADELVVNGEGDFILTERLTLVRTMAMMRAATLLGKPVYLVNSILSYAPGRTDADALALDEVGRTLACCDAVVYRDPASLALHQELYPDVSASWLPDALFAWSAHVQDTPAGRSGYTPETEGLPLPVHRLLADGRPYVVLSGTSRFGIDTEVLRETIAALQERLATAGVDVVFAGSDKPDRRLADALEGLHIHRVDPQIPLSAATRLLWSASAMVSGRYHPSILASLGGTPFLLMESNSHKTRSLLDVVDNCWRREEQPFFSGGVAQAADLADAVTEVRSHRGARSVVRRSAVANGVVVSEGIAAVLSG